MLAAFSHFTEQLGYPESLVIFEKLFITMSYISRNRSDIPLTVSETSEFIATGEEQNGVDNSKKTHASNNLKRKESQASKSSTKSIRKREQWANKFEFIFSCMAFSIGLGNVSCFRV